MNRLEMRALNDLEKLLREFHNILEKSGQHTDDVTDRHVKIGEIFSLLADLQGQTND